ncbi:SDR family NAD(P)-dependent oxidoreductase [Arthrobacter agilis]|uniref:SDR family NAD(P)-dependent oxidoreductase n=1 Tax=Arthrobacter agilis TaxID=37921 RepID=UPI00277F1AFB|nr:SDR family NAD(P)-dependent oxidoreductase [Arthrobacter agilis]MDQ0735755.1 NAD(P)-dependent dehydrogenase (short-subunit alcohol dehydrogenase family) [Arthrobacter agilis]
MKILVTGSTDGLGLAAAETLMAQGHAVVVHARNEDRAAGLAALTAQGAALVVGDLEDRDAVARIAAELNAAEPPEAVIHNAGVWSGRAVMPVNVIAPYLLTALLDGPRRHVYLSSGSHYSGHARLQGVDWTGTVAGSYGDSKLFLTAFVAALARVRPDLLAHAVDPGWVPTRMGGPDAPDDLDLGHRTQVWLATSDDPDALTSGGYWFHRARRAPHEAVHDTAFQDDLLRVLAAETGVALPAGQ